MEVVREKKEYKDETRNRRIHIWFIHVQQPQISSLDFSASHVSSEEDSSLACGVCLLNVNKTSPGASKHACAHLMHAGRQYHTTCANFWCNRVDSVLPSLLPICGLL